MQRRTFLHLATGAAVTAALAPRIPAAAPKRALRKAIMYSTIGVTGTVLERFRAMQEAGFEGIEPLGGMNRAEVVAAFRETGLHAASVCCHTHWKVPLSAPEETTRQAGRDGLRQSLEDARAYGTDCVLLVPGVVRDGVTYQQCWDRSLAEVRRAIPIARELGVKIALENVGNDFLMAPEQALQFLTACHSEWVGWYFDIGNSWRRAPAEEWIRTLGRHILRVHLKDYSSKPAPAGAKSASRPELLGGETNWPAVMAALDQIGYRGWATTEQPANQTATVAAAREMTRRIDRIFAL